MWPVAVETVVSATTVFSTTGVGAVNRRSYDPVMKPHRRVVLRHAADVPGDADGLYHQVADPLARRSWMPELVEVDAPPGPLHAGDRFAGRTRVFGHTFAGDSHTDIAEGSTHLVEEVVVGARFRSEWTFTPTPTGTRLEHVIDLELPGGPLVALVAPLLRWRLARMQNKSLRALSRARR